MGSRGPMPKRSDERLGHPTAKADLVKVEKSSGAEVVVAPPAVESWHPIAKSWYESLATSGQSRFYEPSDWATAVLVAESMSRDLSEQVVGITDSGMVVKDVIPLKGASLGAYLKAFSVLMVTEGDRRRVRLELQRAQSAEASDEVVVLDDYRALYN